MRHLKTILRPPPPGLWSAWSTVSTHSHMLRSKALSFEEAKSRLVGWCRERQIAALGVGSPWEPVSGASYGRCEGVDRDRYDAGLIPPETVMDREPIGRLFDDLNRASAGATLFYQDNENPKGRFGHIWYFGYHYDFPAWHDYDQNRPVSYYAGDPQREINPLTGQPHHRRCTFEIVASQRRAGALAVWAHPTSWWREQGRFITNIASESVLHLLADGRLDGFTVQGYDACHRSYQALWFHLLDTGAIVPGFAEMDGCFDTPKLPARERTFLNAMPLPRPLESSAIVCTARTGRLFATNGAFLALDVDGVPMGRVCPTAAGTTHRVRVEAYPVAGQSLFSRLDLIGRGGQVLLSIPAFAGGIVEAELAGAEGPGYVVARAFGEHDNPDAARHQEIRDLAIANPVYLHPAGFRLAPMTTRATLRIGTGSPWLGGELRIEAADGSLLETHSVRADALTRELPASARITLRRDGVTSRPLYIAMENERVEGLLRYLHDGEFLHEWPTLMPGEVPPEAFRIADMREALAEVTVDL